MTTNLPSEAYEFLLVDDSGEGVTLNTDATAFAPFVDIDKVSGLDQPDFRETFRDHEGVDGGFLDAEFEKGRDIVLGGTVYGPSVLLESYLDNLKHSYAPRRTPTKFFFYVPGVGLRYVYVKPRGVRYDWDQARRTGQSPIQFRMYAEDPRLYSYPSMIQEVPLVAYQTSGFGFNLGFSFGFGGSTISDGFTAVNTGNRSAPLVVTIYGPCRIPRLVNDTTGQALIVNITLGANDVLVVDMLNHTVQFNGVGRRNLVTSNGWFLVAPRANSLRFQAGGGSSGATGPVLNANSTFESNIANWTASSGTPTMVQSNDFALFGNYSLKFGCDGAQVNHGPLSEFITVLPSTQYTHSAWTRTLIPMDLNMAISWYDSGQVLISSNFLTPVPVIQPNVWQRTTMTAISPATAAFAKIRPSRTASSQAYPTGTTIYTDQATLNIGDRPSSYATFQWASAWR